MKYIEKGNVSLLLAILLLFASSHLATHEGGLSISHAKIVFTSQRSGDTFYPIYVMEDDGSDVQRITNPDFYDVHPRWFPDGKRIVFERDWERGSGRPNFEFYIINVDGRNEHRFMENHPTDQLPIPSPDGKQILFSSRRAGNKNLFTYHLESKHLKQLTVDGGYLHADWSPNGRQIVYDYAAGENQIWTMNANGGRKRRLSPVDKKGLFSRRSTPRWSPSGKYIMYHEDQWEGEGNLLVDENWELVKESVVVQNVLTGVRTVHKFLLEDIVLSGCWMGDDQTMLLVIKKDWEAPTTKYEIYRYDLVGRRLTNLTNHPGVDHFPHWTSGTLAVFPAGKLTTLWGQLKQVD